MMAADLRVHRATFRVRYSETDQMGTFYNSRALEWMEVGRTEAMRAWGVSYAEMEKRGVLLPLVEAHVKFEGRARYDDLLEIATWAAMAGRASVRFEQQIVQADSRVKVASGWTVHAVVDGQGKVIRCPEWVVGMLNYKS